MNRTVLDIGWEYQTDEVDAWEREHRAARSACVFCRIADGLEPAHLRHAWPDAVVFVPLSPVTEGHLLVVPRAHVADARVDPSVTAAVFGRAAEIAGSLGADCNLITSMGPYATQSVWHLHVHVVPRRDGDGLRLPWSRV